MTNEINWQMHHCTPQMHSIFFKSFSQVILDIFILLAQKTMCYTNANVYIYRSINVQHVL